jgi:hypothetical protein
MPAGLLTLADVLAGPRRAYSFTRSRARARSPTRGIRDPAAEPRAQIRHRGATRHLRVVSLKHRDVRTSAESVTVPMSYRRNQTL